MKKYYTIILFVLSISIAHAQYEIGHQEYTITDASRGNREITGHIYYPADMAGDNVSLANNEFPFIVFGHGFGMSWSEYQIWWETLVEEGYIIAFPTTENSVFPFPSHGDFGEDLAFVINHYMNENDNASSDFYEHLTGKNAVMGHSMGGGSSYLAAGTFDADVETVVTMAAADTDPSAISAAVNISVPVLTMAGSADCVVMGGGAPIDIYNGLNNTAYKAYVEITDASHCQFGLASTASLCTLGEFCGGFLSLPEQHNQMFLNAQPWLDYFLKGDCDAWSIFHENLINNTAHTYQEVGTGYALELEIDQVISIPGALGMSNIGGGNDFTYQWYMNGNLIPDEISDTYQATATGDYTLVAINEYGCEIESNTISFINVSNENIQNNLGYDIFPTLVENKINIILHNNSPLETRLEWLDIAGNSVRSTNQNLRENEILIVDISHFPKGIYILKIVTKEGSFSRKIVKI
ncbi:MAG: dienelactone hydrolase [Maribacter sp.]|jgi:dienelactone hydrolase